MRKAVSITWFEASRLLSVSVRSTALDVIEQVSPSLGDGQDFAKRLPPGGGPVQQTHVLQGERKVGVKIDVGGLGGRGSLELFDRQLEPLLVGEKQTQLVVQVGRLRIQALGTGQDSRRLVVLTALVKG